MKRLLNISDNIYYYILLGFIFLINISIGASYILFTFLSIGLILYFLSGKRHSIEKFTIKRYLPPFFKYFVLYILFTLTSILFSLDRKESFIDSKELFIFLLFPLFFLILNTEKRIKTSLIIILISGIIHSFTGIYQGLTWGITLDRRIKGFTSHWMTFAGLMMFIFIFFLVKGFYEKKKVRIIYFTLLIPVIAAIGASLTRNVWVGTFIAVGAFIVYYNYKVLYLGIPLLIILAIFLPQSVKSRFTSIVDLNNDTNKDRIYMAKTGFNIFREYPLFGVGANNIKKVYDKYKPEGAPLNEHLHNNFIQTLAERGIFTLLALIAAFISIIFNLIYKIRNGTDFQKKLATGVLFTFFGFLIAGMFEYNFGHSQIKFILFFFISLPFIEIVKPGLSQQEQILHKKKIADPKEIIK